MKKTFILIASIILTVSASAQLQLLKTIDGNVRQAGTSVSPMYADNGLPVQYFVKIADDRRSATFYDATTLNEYKVVIFSTDIAQIVCAFKYVWALEDKLYFLAIPRDEEENSGLALYDENGIVIQTFSSRYEDFGLIQTTQGYLFYVCQANEVWKITSIDIYSVPGNGESTTDINEVISSTPRANRKALRNGHVFVDTPEHVYNALGGVMR
ncbi:MAG: hypothetical protein MJZ65_02630 [Paludibacteraceae bacterium]|nr:hypothetical protein [Paludibacteraceae bacterium]